MADAQKLAFGNTYFFQGATSISTFVMNQSTDAMEFIFQAEDAVTIDTIGFNASAKTGTATTWKISLQGVDGTGIPDGTIKSSGNAAATFTNSSVTTGSMNYFSLTSSYTTTRGEILAIVIAYDSGTAPSAGVNDLTISGYSSGIMAPGLPYPITNDNGARTRQSGNPVFGYKAGSATYGLPIKATYSSGGINSGSNPNEFGFGFTLPSAWGSTYQIAKFRLFYNPPAAATNSLVWRLYDGTTVIQSYTYDCEHTRASAMVWHEFTFSDSSLTSLNFGSTYRIVAAPQTANNHFFRGISVDNASDFDAYSCKQLFWLTTRNGGSWTDTATTRLFSEIVLADWTAPAGGGTNIFSGEF